MKLEAEMLLRGYPRGYLYTLGSRMIRIEELDKRSKWIISPPAALLTEILFAGYVTLRRHQAIHHHKITASLHLLKSSFRHRLRRHRPATKGVLKDAASNLGHMSAIPSRLSYTYPLHSSTCHRLASHVAFLSLAHASSY
ncbi:hypothetical protein Droror1_Dr00010237 [Drosera rotundifolia]